MRAVLGEQSQFLSNDTVDRDSSVAFSPLESGQLDGEHYEWQAPSLLLDGEVPPDNIFYGAGADFLGDFSKFMPSFPDHDGIYLIDLLVKPPGTAEHSIPAALDRADPKLKYLLREFSKHQFKFSQHAKDKVGELLIRKIPTFAIGEQIGNVWHLDNTPFDRDGSRMFNFPSDREILNLRDQRLQASRYSCSNAFGTWVQTQRSSSSLILEHFMDTAKNVYGFESRQVEPYEGVLTNTDVFHKAANTEESGWPENSLPTHRVYVHLAYSSTKEIAARMGLELQ